MRVRLDSLFEIREFTVKSKLLSSSYLLRYEADTLLMIIFTYIYVQKSVRYPFAGEVNPTVNLTIVQLGNIFSEYFTEYFFIPLTKKILNLLIT